MRRVPILVSLFAVILVGLVVGAGFAGGAFAQEGTPAAEEEIPEGVTFEPLGFGAADELPAPPADLFLFRIGLEPDASFPLDPEDPSVALVYVESGEVTFEVDAPITVLRAAGPGTPFPMEQEEFAAGTAFALSAGDSAVVPPRVAGEARNEGSEPVAVLVANVGPLEGENGEGETATPVA